MAPDHPAIIGGRSPLSTMAGAGYLYADARRRDDVELVDLARLYDGD